MRRIAIVGSRNHPDLSIVNVYLEELDASGEDLVIISGGAMGVDQYAVAKARNLDMTCVVYQPVVRVPVEVESYRKRSVLHCVESTIDIMSGSDALLFRNTLIALDCTEMMLFPEGSKGGCWDAAREAKRFKRPVNVRLVNGDAYEYETGPATKSKGSWRQKALF